jgi:hypothetical protein
MKYEKLAQKMISRHQFGRDQIKKVCIEEIRTIVTGVPVIIRL